MTRKLCAAAGCIVLSVAATTSSAQDADAAEDGQQEEVIITGTRSAKAVDKIPGAITVVSPQELERTLSLTEDATAVLARSVPGYSESSQALNTIGETLR